MLPKSICPYTGPFFGPSDKRGPMQGPTVVALKRALGRGGYPELPMTEVYGKSLEHQMALFQKREGLYASGQYGIKTWDALRRKKVAPGKPNQGEHWFDDYSCQLLRSDNLPTTPADRTRYLIEEYLRECERWKRDIHYRQFRPMNHLSKDPRAGFTCDCSGLVTSAYYAGGAPDPNGLGYSGAGFTGTLYSHNRNRKVTDGHYEIGDVSLYGRSAGSTTHTTICVTAGSKTTAVFMSHGSELGPYSTRLYYRPDVLCVVRPRLGDS